MEKSILFFQCEFLNNNIHVYIVTFSTDSHEHGFSNTVSPAITLGLRAFFLVRSRYIQALIARKPSATFGI